MATLNEKRLKSNKKKKVILWSVITAMEIAIAPLLVYLLHQLLSFKFGIGFRFDFNYITAIKLLLREKNFQLFFLLFQLLWGVFILYCEMNVQQVISKVDEQKITEYISIPIPAGNGQHGAERFLTEKEKANIYDVFKFTGKEQPQGKGGVVVHFKKDGKQELIYYIGDDKHTLIIGASGSGKSRRIILETLCLQVLSGLSVIVSDVKGELFYYTSPFARNNGYKTLALDLRNPEKSVHYNFLQPILDSLEEGDTAQAIDYTWDLVSVLVGEPKGEPLWTNGESAAIAAAILAVALDAPEEYRNLTNVYYFLAYMCKPDVFGEMPISSYLSNLPDTHPAKGVFAMAEIAADKTRASFFTSALGTLKLFTNPKIAEMTGKSDFKLQDIGLEKTIIYMIIPDEKKTMYPLVSIFVTQMYTALVECANKNGLRLPVNTDFDLDEVGNFPYIPVLGNILSAGRSRGVRANLVIQDYQQLESKYKDDFKNIKTNCQIKVYLKSDDPDTLKQLSEGLGKYTVEVSSANTSASDTKKNSLSFSTGSSLTGRALLEQSELKRFKSPDAMVSVTGEYSGINHLPDLSKWHFNEILGLGNEEHNTKIMIERERARESHPIPEIQLWGIWNDLNTEESEGDPEETTGRVSFI